MNELDDPAPLTCVWDQLVHFTNLAKAGTQEGAPGAFVLHPDLGDNKIDAGGLSQVLGPEFDGGAAESAVARLRCDVHGDIDGAAAGPVWVRGRLIAKKGYLLSLHAQEKRREGRIAEIGISELRPG
jgi:hypothetical protein